MFAILILLSFFGYGIAYLILKYTVFNYWKKRNVPFAKPNFIFGNIWDVISLRKTWSAFIDDLHSHYDKERFIGMFTMFKPALLIRDLDLIKDFLIKDFDSFHNNWFEADMKVDPLFGQNPFVLNDKQWKRSRSILTPQLTEAKIKSIFPQIQNVCTTMIQYIKDESNTKKSTCFEVTDLSARFTGEVVMTSAFGLEAQSFLKQTPETFVIDGTSSGMPTKFTTFKRTLGLLFGMFSRLFKVTFYGDPVPQVFPDIIKCAINDRAQHNIVRKDFLNYLLELKSNHKIDNSEVFGFAFTMFLDSYETSFSVLAYTLLQLSLHPEIQETARNSVEMIVQKYDGEITYDTFKELSYLKNVVLETLRKISVIKVMSKVCTNTYVMHDPDNNRDIIIEKGTPVFWSVREVHNNPKYYPEPDKFDPDRFTDEAKQSRPKYSFLGFGDGPRICPGRRYAITQIVLALASILLNYELHFNSKTVLPIAHDSFHVSDVPVSGLYIDFIPRTNRSH